MKKCFQILNFTFVIVFSQLSLAQIDRKGNGGDMCEDRIKIIRNDLDSWISQGGSSGLTLSSGISVAQYNAKMHSEISQAEISCIDDKVMIGSVEKTCKNFVNTQGVPQIVCNNLRFMATSESDQYILIHHEYAGLSGFEVNNGQDSNYTISNQISGYLADETVKKLVIKPVARTDSPRPLGPFDRPRSVVVEKTFDFSKVSFQGNHGAFPIPSKAKNMTCTLGFVVCGGTACPDIVNYKLQSGQQLIVNNARLRFLNAYEGYKENAADYEIETNMEIDDKGYYRVGLAGIYCINTTGKISSQDIDQALAGWVKIDWMLK